MSLADWRTYYRYYRVVHRISAPGISQSWKALRDRNARVQAVQLLLRDPLMNQLTARGVPGPPPPPGGIFPPPIVAVQPAQPAAPAAAAAAAAIGIVAGLAIGVAAGAAAQAQAQAATVGSTASDANQNLIIDDASDAFPFDHEDETWKERKAALLTTDINEGDDEGWQLGWPAGDSKNAAGFFVHLDQDGKVDDRMVVKDTYVTRHAWTDGLRWDAMDARKRIWRPMEYGIQRRLRRSHLRHLFAGVRKCKVYPRKLMYRMFTDYCAGKDGKWLMKRYRDKNEFVPEPMLWNIFEGLVEAALIMQRGVVERPVSGSDWWEVVHRDLKPDNVFFDEQRQDAAQARYPAYAAPVLGDFGSAIQTHEADPLNPALYIETVASGELFNGERGYQAPETLPRGFRRSIEGDATIAAHTNVWGIGMTMLSFMQRTSVEEEQLDFLSKDKRKREPVFGADIKEYYSDTLTEVVQECTSFKPEDRWKPETLLDEIRSYTSGQEGGDDEAGDSDMVNGLRSNLAPLNPDIPWRVDTPRDEYALGFTAHELPDRPTEETQSQDGTQPYSGTPQPDATQSTANGSRPDMRAESAMVEHEDFDSDQE